MEGHLPDTRGSDQIIKKWEPQTSTEVFIVLYFDETFILS